MGVLLASLVTRSSYTLFTVLDVSEQRSTEGVHMHNGSHIDVRGSVQHSFKNKHEKKTD